jgi:GNAT superfamily N-acetyltransferase
MRPADLAAVLALQATAYRPEFHEPLEVFAGKLAHHPHSAWVIEDDAALLAYLFAQPARRGHPPPLKDPGRPRRAPDALHLHDLAVAPAARGGGLARRLVDTALAWGRAQGFTCATLVAVQDSASRWRHMGFIDAQPAKSLASYGADAVYLVRTL